MTDAGRRVLDAYRALEAQAAMLADGEAYRSLSAMLLAEPRPGKAQ